MPSCHPSQATFIHNTLPIYPGAQGDITMKTALLALALVVLAPFAVTADNTLVNFKGGIGVDPVSGIASGAPVSNVVCGVVMPGGIPWRISLLHADVQADGHITVEGHGLLLAGANAALVNAIATNGGQSVRAELFCNTTASSCGTPSFTSAAGVALDSHGDFRIDDTLTPLPSDPCINPVLLIISAANGHWFAAGIQADGDR
jgi:hypothetical protein